MRTSIFRIEAALKEKARFICLSNGGQPEDDRPAEEIAAEVAEQWLAMKVKPG